MSDRTELRDAIETELAYAAMGVDGSAIREQADAILALLDSRPDVAIGTHADWLEKMGAVCFNSYSRNAPLNTREGRHRWVNPTMPRALDPGESVWVVPDEATP